MRRPWIAINPLHHGEEPCLRLRMRYMDAVRRAGGVPVVLPAHRGPAGARDAELEELLARVDGVVLTGGDDFGAEALGLGVTHPAAEPTDPVKQAYDLALTRMALARDLPTLGICYGMQCMGLAGGGTLFQDVPSQRPGAREHRAGAVHDVRAEAGSKLAEVVGLGPVAVVSRHHQALRTVPPPWIVSAMDDETLIEAIERPDLRFAVGVQWHPEIALPPAEGATGLEAGDALFAALVAAAARPA